MIYKSNDFSLLRNRLTPPPTLLVLAQTVSNLLGVIPIIATAYTCQMTVTFVMDDMRGLFSQGRMAISSLVACLVCTAVFLITGRGGPYLFGADVADDVLENFSARQVEVD